MCNMHVHMWDLCKLALSMGSEAGPPRRRDREGARGVRGGVKAARMVHGLWRIHRPGAGRAPPHGPAVELAVASQTSSQTRDETILRDGQWVCQEVGRRGYGFRRLRSEVGGVLRTTREAAGAAVRRAKRLFFRDEG